MRFVMHVKLPIGKFDQAVRDGTVDKKMKAILDEIKPEAAYFVATEGKRGGYLIVNMENTSEIPRLAEPWFLVFDAELDFAPCMTPEDLAKSGLVQHAKKWK